MEKRLFLAVFFSLLVVFAFDVFFKPTQRPLPTHPVSEIDFSVGKEGDLDRERTRPAVGEAPVPVPASASSAPDRASVPEEVFTEKAGPFVLDLSNKGGVIVQIHLADQDYSFPITRYADLSLFSDKVFDYQRLSERTLLFSYSGEGFEVVRKYAVSDDYVIKCETTVKNIRETRSVFDQSLEAFTIDLSRLDKKTTKAEWILFEYSIKTNKKILRKEHASNFNEKWNKSETVPVQWFGFRDRYFATIVEGEGLSNYFAREQSSERLSLGTSLLTHKIEPGQSLRLGFKIYAGPQKIDVLKRAGEGFDRILVFSSWGWLDAIAKVIYFLLGFVHKIVPVWGICIILTSLLLYGAMYPLTMKSMVSMKKMQVVQPKMAALKEKYKNNPEKMNQEVVQLYKTHQVNPLGGCLPLMFQMPIFIGLYQVLWRSIYFRGESFLWIKDLSMPDRLFKLPVTLPFLGDYFNILPILMAGIMFLQQKVNMQGAAGGDAQQQAQQKMMAVVFPVFLGFIFYNFASGLNLYFVVFYVLSTFAQWHIAQSTRKAG